MRSVNLNTSPNRMEVSTMRARQGVTGHNVRYVRPSEFWASSSLSRFSMFISSRRNGRGVSRRLSLPAK
jgi:hypothetical protein